jgi:uncharacterized membrane protein
MRREVAWLHAELPDLVDRGVLSPDAADALRRHYGTPDRAAAVSWGQILLASFGALLVGGGIILILAHNWDDLARPARAAIALGVLVVAQLLAAFAVVRRPASTAWIEATSGFLVAAVGAAMALVGQTYHVGGSFEGLMQAWLWLVVAIPYITGSRLASMLMWALLFVRVWNVSARDADAEWWLVVAAGLPFVLIQIRRAPRSWATALAAIAAAISTFTVGTLTAFDGWRGLWAVFDVSFLAAIVGAASWPPCRDTVDQWRRRLLVPAWLALIVMGTILSFDEVWRTLAIDERTSASLPVMLTALVAVACAALAAVFSIRLARAGRLAAAMAAGAALLVVVLHLFSMFDVQLAGWIAFNLWLLAFGVLTAIEGVRSADLGTANLGLLTLAALIVARFFDTDLSFFARGLVFVAFGVGCLAVNIWMMRKTMGAT